MKEDSRRLRAAMSMCLCALRERARAFLASLEAFLFNRQERFMIPTSLAASERTGIPLSPVADVVREIARGRPVLVLDDAGRENEADLICAADLVTRDAMAMMIREGSGIVCLCIRADKASGMRLRPMVEVNRSRNATAFTQSIEAAFGISTGVSAADRVQTIQCALRTTLERSEIVSPGHVFPLVAKSGGVLERQGHTEAAVDLALLAGRYPAGVLCELMNPDGSMARGAQVADFAARNGLLCTTVEAIREFRTESLDGPA
jgi:3,4-dihydroxy 2-butanone 4-phosphate synthase